jgi:hypothetical protein
MKNAYRNTSPKDTIATAALLAAMFITSVAALFASLDARAAEVAAMPVQTLEPVVVTAPRIKVEKIDTIVVTASRLS